MKNIIAFLFLLLTVAFSYGDGIELDDHQWAGVESTYDSDSVTPFIIVFGSIHPGNYNFNYTPYSTPSSGGWQPAGSTTNWGGTIVIGSDGHTVTQTTSSGSLSAFVLNGGTTAIGWVAVSLTGTGGTFTVNGQYMDTLSIVSVTSDVAATNNTGSSWNVETGAPGTQYTYLFPWTLKSNVTTPHTIQLFVDGNSVDVQQIQNATNGGALSVQSGTATFLTFTFSDTYQWYVDGAPVSNGGALSASGPPSTQTLPAIVEVWQTDKPGPSATPNGGNPSGVPTPTPSPTPTPAPPPTYPQSNSGNITQNPQPSGTGANTPQTTVNNAGTTISGGTSGATNQDMYNDMSQALNDAGNNTQGGYSGVASGTVTDNISTVLSGSGHINDIQTVIDTGTSDMNSAITTGTTMFSGFFTVGSFPTIGTSTTLSLGTPDIMGTDIPLTVDLTPFASLCSLVRVALLLILTWFYFFACVRALRQYFET